MPNRKGENVFAAQYPSNNYNNNKHIKWREIMMTRIYECSMQFVYESKELIAIGAKYPKCIQSDRSAVLFYFIFPHCFLPLPFSACSRTIYHSSSSMWLRRINWTEPLYLCMLFILHGGITKYTVHTEWFSHFLYCMHSFGHTATYQAERKKNYWMKRKTVSKCNMQNRCRTTTTELNSWNEKGKGITADTEAKLQREKKTSKKVENKNTFSQCERCMCRERLFNGKCNWFFLPPPLYLYLSFFPLLPPSLYLFFVCIFCILFF